jgi:hypothetical protein
MTPTREEIEHLILTAPKTVLADSLEIHGLGSSVQHKAKPELVRIAQNVLGSRREAEFIATLRDEIRIHGNRKHVMGVEKPKGRR